MKDTTILAQRGSSGGVKYLTMELSGDTVSRFWGLLGGSEQTTSNTYKGKYIGKSNEMNPEQVAKEDYTRRIEKKCKEGYRIVPDGEDIYKVVGESEEEDATIDLSHPPANMCVSKPTAKVSQKVLEKLRTDGNLRMDVKYNGLCHFIVIDPDGTVKIYTRRWHDHTRKYPDLVMAVKDSVLYVNGSMFVAELVCSAEQHHMTAFKVLSEITKVDTHKGEVAEDVSETHRRVAQTTLKLVVFGIVYLDCKRVMSKLTVRQQWDLALNTLPTIKDDALIVRPQQYALVSGGVPTISDALKFIHKNGDIIEGLIAWDLSSKMEVTMNGKPLRRACYKMKAVKEDDVVVYDYLEGTGDRQGKVGSFYIGKYNEDGVLLKLGRVGSGIKDDESDPGFYTFPFVANIEYDQRFPETGCYQFPRYIGKHPDKVPEEVIEET